MEQNNQNEQARKLQVRAIITIVIVVFLIGIAWLIYFLIDYFRADTTYDKIADEYTTQGEGNWYDMIDVDIADLKLVNQDTRGWLFFENEDISYPIVQAIDDARYLRTSFDGKALRSGSIFLEALNRGDFSDENSIIYGHNMRDESMFGKLKKYKNEPDYYKEHLYFQVITADRIYRYQVFAFNDVSETSDIYTVTFATDEEYAGFIRMVREMSQVDIAVPDMAEPNAADDEKLLQNYRHLATLSTCTVEDDERFVVIGVLVGEYDRINKFLLYDSLV